MKPFVVVAYHRDPPRSDLFHTSELRSSAKTRAGIGKILRAGSQSQVDYPVVAADAIDVVNVRLWPCRVYHCHNDAMRLVTSAKQSPYTITVGVYSRKCFLMRIPRVPSVGIRGR